MSETYSSEQESSEKCRSGKSFTPISCEESRRRKARKGGSPHKMEKTQIWPQITEQDYLMSRDPCKLGFISKRLPPSFCWMLALLQGTLPAHVPSCSERAQPLSNKGIKLRYEEKRQFSGPRSKKISIESVLFTINTTERRKHQLVRFFRLLILPSLDHLTSRKPPSCIIQTVCQHPKTDIGCILYVNISV